MPWSNWTIRRQLTTTPREWENILTIISPILPRRDIDKIEYVAFTIKHYRTVRWRIDHNDPEYCTEQDAINAAKKLLWLLFLSNGSPDMPADLRPLLLCNETPNCRLFIGHEGGCLTSGNAEEPITQCQLCTRNILFTDFDRDGRRDPLALQVAHRTPLSRGVRQHNARNVSWAHRSCNQNQSEQTLDEFLENMRRILEGHGYNVTRR